MTARKAARTALLVTLVAALVSACGDKKDDGKTAATQVAAKVNKGEISIHQINGVLQRSGAIPPEQIKRASGEVLERLIDQELFVQQAMEKKLDRSVAVVQAVEAAKREIYARAYMEQITAQTAKPDAAAVTAFYNENPALFAKRRIYNLQELSVQIADEKIPALMQKIGDAKNVGGDRELAACGKNPLQRQRGRQGSRTTAAGAGSPICRGERWPGRSVAGARAAWSSAISSNRASSPSTKRPRLP